MKRTLWLQSATLGLLLTINVPLWAQPAEPRPTLTVGIHDYVQVEMKTLVQTEEEVKRIFGKIGLDLIWRDIPVPSQESKVVTTDTDPLQPTSAPQLRIFIFPRSMTERMGRSRDALGYAAPAIQDKPTNIAYVFFHRVDELGQIAARFSVRVTRAQILAHAIAHEIGHLMLPFKADALHSLAGIMRGPWEHKDLHNLSRGQLLFTRQQGELIRRELMRRTMELESSVTEHAP